MTTALTTASDGRTLAQDDLPEGWKSVEVQDIFNSFGGGTPNRATAGYWGGSIPWISSGDVKTERIANSSETITKAGLAESSANLCQPSSVLVVVRSGILKHTLPIAVLEREAAINQDIKCFDSGDARLNEWLALALRSSAREILAANREGTTVQSVKYETLKEFVLAVPPAAEQTRILAAVAQAEQHVNAGRERLSLVDMKRFRQSVLAAACSGRLTEDWRGQFESSTAMDLKAAIHRTRMGLGRVARESVEPVLYGADDLPDLPDSWCWANLEEIAVLVTDGDHNPPKRVTSGIPHLTAKNIREWEIHFDDCSYISHGDYQRVRSRYQPREDDVIVTTVGTIGRTAIVPTGSIFSADRNLAAIRLVPGGLLPQILQYILNTIQWQRAMEQASGSSAQPHLYLNDLRAIAIPLIPIDEQREIVRRVEALFKLADAIEKRVAAAQARADKLTQSILAKAFRGELVPTEAELARQESRDYEPASVLLSRISVQRHITESQQNAQVSRRKRSKT
jgi:type I restriction enzyme S subunit